MATVDETTIRQDMPPKGGYAKIHVQRTFPIIGLKTGKRLAAALACLFFAGYYKYRSYSRRKMRFLVEQNDCRLVTTGFYLAERDREWLNVLRRNRDEERELMKDVPGWRVGTFFGEPVYYTLPPEAWWDPSCVETMAHVSGYETNRRRDWHIIMDTRGGPKWYDKYLPFWMERN